MNKIAQWIKKSLKISRDVNNGKMENHLLSLLRKLICQKSLIFSTIIQNYCQCFDTNIKGKSRLHRSEEDDINVALINENQRDSEIKWYLRCIEYRGDVVTLGVVTFKKTCAGIPGIERRKHQGKVSRHSRSLARRRMESVASHRPLVRARDVRMLLEWPWTTWGRTRTRDPVETIVSLVSLLDWSRRLSTSRKEK